MPRKKRSSSPFELIDDDFDDTSSQSSRNDHPPIQRNAANARERARMRVLSSAFGRLKTKLPNIPADTKLSKLDTLRLATMYIKQLKSVVEGEAVARTMNGGNIERSLSNNENNSTSCYLNFNMGVQSMNWPFGFHQHLSNTTSLARTSSSASLMNSFPSGNWCTRDNNNEEQMELELCETRNYEHQHLYQTSSVLTPQHNNQWFSETSSPELDSTSSTCLGLENAHFQQQSEHHHHHHHYQQQQPQQHASSHRLHLNSSHLQPTSTHSPTFQLQQSFPHYTQHQASTSHHLNQTGFVNSSNFQSTSIR